MNDEKLKELLAFDPLDSAERLTGKSYKADEDTMGLGFGLHQSHTRNKEAALKGMDDTTFSNSLTNYLRIAKEEGFALALELPFTCESRAERYFVLFHEAKGLLLAFDTYGSDQINGGHMYFNVKLSKDSNSWELGISGGMARNAPDVLVGDFDCREALRFHIRQLEAAGTLLAKWIERPFLWLLHYGDTHGKQRDGYDYQAINAERIAMLPEKVREAITSAGEPVVSRGGPLPAPKSGRKS